MTSERGVLIPRVNIKRDVLGPFIPPDIIALNGYQMVQTSKFLRQLMGLASGQGVFSSTKFDNTTGDILSAVGIEDDHCRDEFHVALTSGQMNDVQTPRGLLFARAALNSRGNVVEEFLSSGGAILTVRRNRLSRKTLAQINEIADRLNTNTSWISRSFRENQTVISDIPQNAELKLLENEIMGKVKESIVISAIPVNPQGLEKAQEIDRLLNEAVHPLETIYIEQLLDRELIREEIRATMKALLPLAVVELGIGALELTDHGALAKYALLFGSDSVMSLIDTFLQQYRFNQKFLPALLSRCYEIPTNAIMATPFAIAMEQMAKSENFVGMALLGYTSSVLATTAISSAISGLSGARDPIPSDILMIPDPIKRITGITKYYLKPPTREEIRRWPESMRHFFRNPGARGLIDGSMLGVIIMNFSALKGWLDNAESRAAVEMVAGASEVIGLLFRIASVSIEDWIRFITTANRMIDRVNHSSDSVPSA